MEPILSPTATSRYLELLGLPELASAEVCPAGPGFMRFRFDEDPNTYFRCFFAQTTRGQGVYLSAPSFVHRMSEVTRELGDRLLVTYGGQIEERGSI